MASESAPGPVDRGGPAEGCEKDLSGRDRLVSNVLFSWSAHLVFIVAGFVMPRMIDRRLGQEQLGIWDFSWSLVAYFYLVQIGVASSVNRYVATYRAVRDLAGLNRVVSSATCMLAISGSLVLVLTLVAALLLPELFGSRLGGHVRDAQWVVLFLGASVCAQVSSSAFSGVLTGCHRWELQNLNRSGWYVVTATGMVVALLLGGGLRVLAVVTFVGEVLSDVRLVVLAHRACEGLQLRWSLVRWQTITELCVFGGKTLIPGVSKILLDQTTSMLIIAYLGPTSLALFARPRSLMHHIDILVRKMSMTLIPTTSSLESTGSVTAIQELVVKSARYALYLVLPMVLLLVLYGGPIMGLWMGPRYADGWIPAILALGSLAVLVQLPALSILVGLNAHGRAGVARFVASVCSVGLNILVLQYLQWGLVGTAVAVTLPLTLVNLVDIPRLLCRRIGLPVRRYFLLVTLRPALHVLPFVVCLGAARLIFPTRPLVGLVLGGTIGTGALALVYWRWVLPERVRAWVSRLPYKMRQSTA